MSERADIIHDPDYIDWNAYIHAEYSPAPALTKLPDYDSFWRTMGGKLKWDSDEAQEANRK